MNPKSEAERLSVIKDVFAELQALNREHDIGLQRVIFFGSYVYGVPDEGSDIDVVLVSEKWEDVFYLKRGAAIGKHWPLELPRPEMKPYTPDEFQSYLQERDYEPVNHALECGIEIPLAGNEGVAEHSFESIEDISIPEATPD